MVKIRQIHFLVSINRINLNLEPKWIQFRLVEKSYLCDSIEIKGVGGE
jgi:hypothetical protein